MKMPIISIIIPCFNHGLYIEDTLKSLYCQTYQDYEIILVNDGSTDTNTLEVLKRLKGREKLTIYNQENKGVVAAKNFGVEMSSGEYILPLDADDLINESYLEEALKTITLFPDIKIVYPEVEFFGKKEGVWELPPYSFEKLLEVNMIVNTSLFRKKDFLQAGGYHPNMSGGYEDWDLWISMLKNGGYAVKNSAMQFKYRIHEVSRNRSIKDIQKVRNLIFKNHIEAYNNNFQDPLNLICEVKRLQEFEKSFFEIRHSVDYRIGTVLLYPLRQLKKFYDAITK